MSRRSFSFDKPAMDNTEDLTGFNLLYGITQVTGGVLCVLVLVWTIEYRNGFGWSAALRFNWHPLLLTIGMVFLFANSMTIFRSLRDLNKKLLKYLHTAIHTVVLVLIIIGLWAIISLRIDSNHPHFRSLHSWVGIAATVVFFLQWLIGIIAYLYPGLPPAWRSGILPLHVYFGIAGFILAIAGCVTGYLEMGSSALKKNNGELVGESLMINIIGLLFMIYGLLAVYIVTKSSYKRLPRSYDQ